MPFANWFLVSVLLESPGTLCFKRDHSFLYKVLVISFCVIPLLVIRLPVMQNINIITMVSYFLSVIKSVLEIKDNGGNKTSSPKVFFHQSSRTQSFFYDSNSTKTSNGTKINHFRQN